MATALPVSFDDVREAAARLNGVAHRTPVLTSRTLNALVGAEVFIKCENFQRVGAFKFRGAYNAAAQLSPSSSPRASPPTPPATTPRPPPWPPGSWAPARSS
ncbi:pyridoxal-phosphate dependent enzyme [Thermocatellispora tengchongensis]|uniref:pyridoxal-phosphate dependent enzyme n=1 Tax=Thermocatellispora tengchongensis TaxID=1073253 RepID=UPI0036272C41